MRARPRRPRPPRAGRGRHRQRPATPPKTPLPVVTPTAPTTPVGLTCDQVVTADQLYAYNPNFGADPNYAPKDGSLEKKIVDWKGVSCGWLNQTSNEVIQIAVAKPPVDVMESLKNAAITDSKPVPTYGVPPQVEGYFKPGQDRSGADLPRPVLDRRRVDRLLRAG